MRNVIKLISLFLDIIDLIWISLGDGSIYLFRIIPLELSSLVVFFSGFYKFRFSHYHVFVYQERWAEYRYHPSLITGRFRSTAASTLDSWHLAQKFAYRPLLNADFISEDPPISRVSAVNTALTNQFIFDSFFNIKMARPYRDWVC